MAVSNNTSFRYSPGIVPNDPAQLRTFLAQEFINIKLALEAAHDGFLEKQYAQPPKRFDGDIRYADGTSWNPGSGAGIYYYNGTTWKFLG